MSLPLLLQQCPVCLARITGIVFVMGGRWPYSCCFASCCLQNSFNVARRILVELASTFFSILRFILSVRSSHGNLSMAV